MQVNDTHGYIDRHQEIFWDGAKPRHEEIGGFAKISGYFKSIREDRGRDSVIALDCGDTLHGTFAAVHSKGEALIPLLNRLELDAWTIHWDIVYGRDRLLELSEKLNYPVLAINGYAGDTESHAFDASKIFDRGGVRVGVIGIGAYIIDKTLPREVCGGLRFTIGERELPGEIKKLRSEGAELIIVISHLGFPQDIKLAEKVDGINILLSGHTHNRTYKPTVVNKTTIIQSGCHASFVGRLDVEVSGGKVIGVKHELVKLDDEVESDPEMQKLVDDIYSPHREMLDEVVGRTETDLNRFTTLESTMDNLLLDAAADAAGVNVAFSNGWRYGAPIPAGVITVNDLWNIIPTDPPVSMTEMTGKEIRELIEENLEHTFSRDPFKQMGGYMKRCRGVNIYCKLENPEGERIQEFFIEGERLEADRTYTVAFLTEQGVPEKYGSNRRDLKINAIDALKAYLRKNSPINVDLRGTVTVV